MVKKDKKESILLLYSKKMPNFVNYKLRNYENIKQDIQEQIIKL